VSGYVERSRRSRLPVVALAGNVAVSQRFTEVAHLSAFAIGLGAIPLAYDRSVQTVPRARTRWRC
jgi:hypothetical protein